MDHPAPIESLPEAAQKALKGPPPLRMMVARGMAPLPPVALVAALYALAHDADEKLATAARDTLGKLPKPVLDGALASAEAPPALLDYLATRLEDQRDVVERIVQHAAVPPDTVARLASRADEALCELIATNEQRLLAHPAIIEALYLNRALRMSTADRLVELAARNGVELNLPGFREAAASLKDQLIPEPGEVTPADEMFREAMEEAAALEQGEEDVVDRDEDGEEQLKKKFEKVQKRLSDMTVSEKIRAALIGTASQRAILVRNPNRVIAMAAIASPKVQEGEAISISASRQVSEDVLRFISNKRDWIRLHQVKTNLCFNPKTPVSISLRLLPHLREVDLKALQRSKNIPSALRTGVRQLLAKREAKS
jgi:hypothetical protein